MANDILCTTLVALEIHNRIELVLLAVLDTSEYIRYSIVLDYLIIFQFIFVQVNSLPLPF